MKNIEISKRLEIIREFLGKKQAEFARSIDMHPAAYSRIKKGEIGVSTELLGKLLQEHNINPVFMLTGIGDYQLDNEIEEAFSFRNLSSDGIINKYNQLITIEEKGRFIEELAKDYQKLETEFLQEKSKRLDLLEDLRTYEMEKRDKKKR